MRGGMIDAHDWGARRVLISVLGLVRSVRSRGSRWWVSAAALVAVIGLPLGLAAANAVTEASVSGAVVVPAPPARGGCVAVDDAPPPVTPRSRPGADRSDLDRADRGSARVSATRGLTQSKGPRRPVGPEE